MAPAAFIKSRGGLIAAALAVLILIVAAALLLPRAAGVHERTETRRGRRPPPAAGQLPPSVAILAALPTTLADMTPDQARASNLAWPFVAGRIAPAPPLAYAGTPEDKASATACLGAAVLYEAGNDKIGEQAVAQVVLNRLRHPAFPKTVCGVVFQGSERKTGCQFTFTCDGSLARVPNPAAWAGAKAVAEAALAGFVVKQVGAATHYHADWVVPYWRDSLEKVTEVHTHLFYRWPGAWGRPGALTGRYQPPERIDPRIESLAGPEWRALMSAAGRDTLGPEGAAAPPPRQSLTIEGVSPAQLKGAVVRLMDADAAQYVLQLDPSEFSGSYAVTAYAICRSRPDCLVLGWTSEERIPRELPVLPAAMRTLSFLYRKSSVLGVEQQYWDCRESPRKDAAQCLPNTRP